MFNIATAFDDRILFIDILVRFYLKLALPAKFNKNLLVK
jgi:hypothetical protein